MPRVESANGHKFFTSYVDAISTPHQYCPTNHSKKLITTTPEFFVGTRIKALRQILFTENRDSYEMCLAFLSEYLVYLCIAEPLECVGFVTDLAPFEIENGHKDGRGLDVVVSSNSRPRDERIPLLGLNVKLRKSKTSQISESHAYDPRLIAPYITVSLGNWKVTGPNQSEFLIRDWIEQMAIPHIHKTGNIPCFADFRRYVFIKVENTLYDYLYKVLSHFHNNYTPNDSQIRLFPPESREMRILRDKLLTMHSTFAELRAHL